MRKSINIGTWVNYQPYTSEEQRSLQRKNLTPISTGNRIGNHVNFIYSDYIENLNAYVEDMLGTIVLKDAMTELENEIYYTTKIEGAKTTRIRTSQLHRGMPIDKMNEYSERMVVNAFRANELMNLYNKELAEDKLIEVWKQLTCNACDNFDIQGNKYRIDDVTIGTWIPVEAKHVPQLMQQFFEFYHSDELNDIPVIKAIILHFLFETIHPFCDGNGRLGRLLLNHFLMKQGFDAAKSLSLQFIGRMSINI